jgi:hypothetical protein
MEPFQEFAEHFKNTVTKINESIMLAGNISLANDLRRQGDITALLSMVVELASHQGLDQESVVKNYSKRQKFFHGKLLENLGDNEGAAQLDNRTFTEISTEENFPPLFP